MLQQFAPGDYLIFQLESGYGLLRVLGIEGPERDPVWHIAAYNELFMDVDSADAAIQKPDSLTLQIPHVALTNRAFESTQVAKMSNAPLDESELSGLSRWQNDADSRIQDRSIRLLIGLR